MLNIRLSQHLHHAINALKNADSHENISLLSAQMKFALSNEEREIISNTFTNLGKEAPHEPKGQW